MMRLYLLALLSVCAIFAADQQQTELSSRAQLDFTRVQLAASVSLPDAIRCIQTQAAFLSVAPSADVATTHFRKGYCALSEAAITGNAADFAEASSELDKAIETWPQSASHRDAPAEPVSSAVRILDQVAKLEMRSDSETWQRAGQEIATALEPPVCPPTNIPLHFCQALLVTGREWLGWMELQRDDLYRATTELARVPESAWYHWALGRQAFRDRQYGEAARRYQAALDIWNRGRQRAPGDLAMRLQPRPVIPQMLSELGGAELLAGDLPTAFANLDAALRADPTLAGTLYLRARTEEQLGQTGQALADYSLASRTALAHAQGLASGEGHLYRGISLYRRRDFAAAEDAFADALNFSIPDPLRADAAAWRYMAAVASGACSSSRQYLEDSLARVSPYFPKDEARRVAASCPISYGAGGLGFQ